MRKKMTIRFTPREIVLASEQRSVPISSARRVASRPRSQALRVGSKNPGATPGTTTEPQTTVKRKEHKMRIEGCACGMDRK